MKLVRPTILVLLAALAFGGCTKNNPETPPEAAPPLFPLAFGNWWNYHIQAFSADSSVAYDAHDTLAVVDTSTLKGKHVFIALENNSKANTHIYYYSGDTLFDLQPVTNTTDTSIGIFIFNTANVANNLILIDSIGMDSSVYYTAQRLDSTNAIVNTGYATLSCFKYRTVNYLYKTFDLDSTVEYDYYASGVGLVKQEAIIPDGKGGHYRSFELVLENYVLH